MWRVLSRVLGVLVLAGFAYLNVDYWRDPLFWRRWGNTVTHLSPEYFDFRPTDEVASREGPALPVAAPGAGTIDPAALRDAEAYAARFDSFAFLVVHHGVVQSEWYRPDWTADRLTQSQSMHKTVVALLVGAAIGDGAIRGPDDPVGRYLTEWQGDPRGRITIRQLLNMSSGLAQYPFTLNPFARDSAFRFLFSEDRPAVVLRTPLVWEPGSRYEYNDLNAQLAGMIVERATGRRYAEYLSARLWQPIGAPAAKVWLDHPGGGAMTACCLLAPARAWLRLGLMLKDGGVVDGRQVYPRRWIEDMITPSGVYAGYGLFTWLGAGMRNPALPGNAVETRRTEPYLAPDLFMLLGHGGQRVYISRTLDLVVVRLGPFSGYAPLKPDWDDAHLLNTVIRGIRKQ